MGTSAELERYEQRFRRAGLPLFIEDFSPTHDIYTRAAPLLALVFLAEMIGATSLDWAWWQNLLAAIGGLIVLVVGFGLLNGFRGRPFWSWPIRFGIPELAVFVLLPALLPVVTQGQLRQFFGVAVGNLVLVGAVYAVVGYGLIATTYWGLRRLAGELASSVASLIRVLPLLLVFSLVLFVTADMWQVFAQRMNLSINLVIRQSLQVLVVSAGVGLFFVAFGMLAISKHIYELWGVPVGSWSYVVTLQDHPLVVSASLVKVAVGIANFTGLYYSIALLTDSTFRTDFLDHVSTELRDLFTARSEYLTMRGSGESTGIPTRTA
jgi:hypothetical protein